MRNTKWWVMAGLLSFAGVGMAGEKTSEIKSDAREAGEDVRTGMERTQEDVKQDAREVKEDAKDVAADVGEKAADKTERAGSSVSQAIREGTQAVQGQPTRLDRGVLREGDDVRNTITTDAVGMVFGEGLNLQYLRPVTEKISLLGGARFARARAAEGSLTSFGLAAGADYFLIGRRNEGLRIGPRIEMGLGGETVGDNSFFGSYGAAGELGYNWIASNGLTAGAGAGVRARMAATRETGDTVTGGIVNPYAKLNVGYSW